MSEWVSVENDLPPEGEHVLVISNEWIEVGCWFEETEYEEGYLKDRYPQWRDVRDEYDIAVYYWMPLPDSPKPPTE